MVSVPTPPHGPIVDATGHPTRRFFTWLASLHERTGGADDKVDAAYQTANAAAPGAAQVVGAGGLQGGGEIGGNTGVALYVKIGAAASLPTSGLNQGDWAYAVDGRKPGESGGAGTGVPCFFSAGAWVSACSGATVTT